MSPLPLPPIALTTDLRPPNLPPAPREVKKKTFQFPEPMEAEPQDEADFALPKPDPISQTDFTRPKTTLVDKRENVVEVLPKVPENMPDFEEEEKAPNEADTFGFEFSDALNKLFPDVRNHVKTEEVSATKPTLYMDALTKILLNTTKDELPPQLDFFTGGENKKFATRARGGRSFE